MFLKVSFLLSLIIGSSIAHAELEADVLEHLLDSRIGVIDSFNLPVTAGFYNNEDGSPLIELIDHARKTIDIEIYMMDDKDLHAALKRAMRERQVRVRVVKDPSPLGESCNPFKNVVASDSADCKAYKDLATEIEARGGQFVPFNKKELCGIEGKSCFEHGKMVIVDGKRVMLSTGNFNSSNLCNLSRNPSKCNRDFSFVSRRPFVVKTLEAIFEKDLKGVRYDIESLMSERFKRKVTVSPLSQAPLIEFVQSAKHSIEVENQYLKEKEFNQALIAAANRGVKVSITLASLCSFGKPSERQAEVLAELFHPFDEAGISVRMFTDKIKVKGKPGYMHAKAIVVDGRRAWVGSVNGSSMSMNQNREYGYFFWNPISVWRLKRVLRSDHQDPNGETWLESLACLKDGGGSGSEE